MKRDTRKAYRARAKQADRWIEEETTRQRAESDARITAAREAERADRKTEGSITIAHFYGFTQGSHFIRDQFGWRRVLKVNSRSVTVPSVALVGWTDTVRFEKIREVKS